MEALAEKLEAASEVFKHPVLKGWVEDFSPSSDGRFYKLSIRYRNEIYKVDVPVGVISEFDITEQSIVKLYGTDLDNIEQVEVVHRAEFVSLDLKNPDLFDTKNRHLHIRTPQLRATAMFRHYIQKYAREFLDERGFYGVQTPILTEASCVCSGDVFAFPYYGKKIANLIQSPWMYADALSAGVEKVYTLNPSFRREEDETNIHLVEIWQLQVDLTWASNEDVMELEQGLLNYIASNILENHRDLYEMAGLRTDHLEAFTKPFARITYDKSLEKLKALGYDMEYGDDYSQEQSDALSATFSTPYFITDFPIQLKNFWFPKHDGSELTPSNDLFAHTGHGEIIGGGERISDAAGLKENLEYFGHDEEEFDWFVDTRRFGCAPHAGFSMGFDRIVAMLMGVDDIRKATLFPRLPHGSIKP